MPVVIKMKGLPFEATSRDIQMFFDGLSLREKDIHLAANKDGKASGISFAVFNVDDDARKAMYRTGKYMGKRYIELFLSSQAEMESVLYNGVPEPKHKGGKEAMGERASMAMGFGGRGEAMEGRNRDRSTDGLRGFFSGRDEPRVAIPVDKAYGKSFDKRERVSRRGHDRSLPGSEERPGSRGRAQMHVEDMGRRMSGGGVEVGGVQQPGRWGDMPLAQQMPPAHLPEWAEGVGYFQNDPRANLNRIDPRDGAAFEEMLRQPQPLMATKPIAPDDSGRGQFASAKRSRDRSRSPHSRERGQRGREPRERERQRARGDHNSDNGSNSQDQEATSTIVRMFGLPFESSKRDLYKFFNGLKIASIDLLKHKSGKNQGKNTGVAFVVFKSNNDASKALKMDRSYIGHRYIELRSVPKDTMVKELEANERGARGPKGGFRGDKAGQQRGSREDLAKEDLDRERRMLEERRYALEDRGSSSGRYRDEYEDPRSSRRAFDDPPDQAYARNLQQFQSTLQDQLARVVLPGGAVDVNQALETLKVMTASMSGEGCVVGIRNLPSSITADQILDFFYGFNVLPETIKIHYLSPGRSSGDAMITFPTSSDAYAAIDQLNFRPVGKKKVQLFLV